MRKSGSLVAALPLLVAFLAGCFQGAQASCDDPGRGPCWSFQDTDGETHERDDVEGDAAVLFFMATWCSSCRANAPRLASLHAEFGPQGVEFLTLSWDPYEDADDLEGWKVEFNQSWPHGVDEGSKVATAMGVKTQSTVVVLNETGHLSDSFGYRSGGIPEDQMRDAIVSARPDVTA